MFRDIGHRERYGVVMVTHCIAIDEWSEGVGAQDERDRDYGIGDD